MEESNSFFKYLGGRKMGLTLIAMLVGGLVETQTASGISESFTYLLIGLVGAFVTGNAATTIMALKGTAPAEPAPVVDTSAVEARVAALEQAYQADMAVVGKTMESFNTAIQESNKRVNTLLTTRK